MRVADIMARTIDFIPPDATALAAAELMGEIDVGALPVGTEDDLQGILTDRDIPEAVASGPVFSGRDPFPFETSAPGVFAVGDVRHGSLKRVAAAVGEGSSAVREVHAFLALHT